MAARTISGRRGLAAGAALGVGAAAAGAFAFLRRLRSDRRRADARPQAVVCECGQAFRVTGMDRHRVYWLIDAAESDPLLGERCPACDRALPVPAA